MEKERAFKSKRQKRLYNYYFEKPDIKYRGPLSYRYLRIIAWICLALSAFVTVSAIGRRIIDSGFLNNAGSTVLSIFGDLSAPLFLIASFSIILNRREKYKSLLIVYLAGFLVFFFAVLFVYLHYFRNIFKTIELTDGEIAVLANRLLGNRVQLNVFVDMLGLSLFYLFLNYKPVKHFQGKKLIHFRLLSILPLVYLAVGFTLKAINAFNEYFSIPIYALTLLPTKSPLVHLIFVTITIWIKRREKFYIELGGTKKQYEAHLKTNKNSLSFSKTLCIIIVMFAIIDLIIGIVFTNTIAPHFSEAEVNKKTIILGIGQCLSLLLAIPFIILFSYTRTHKDKTMDAVIPFIGIFLLLFVYIEGAFRVLMNLLK